MKRLLVLILFLSGTSAGYCLSLSPFMYPPWIHDLELLGDSAVLVTMTLRDVTIDGQSPEMCLAKWRFADSSFQILTQKPTVGPNEMLLRPDYIPLAVDSAGTIWVGVPNKLLRIRNGSITELKRTDGLIDDRIIFMDFDSRGRLWCCSLYTGLCVLDESGWIRYPLDYHVVNVGYFPAGFLGILGFTISGQDKIWISGVRTPGIASFDGVTWSLPKYEWGPIDSSSVNNILGFDNFCTDQRGNLWWASHDGLVRTQRGDSTIVIDLRQATDKLAGIHSMTMGPDGAMYVGSTGFYYVIKNDLVTKVDVQAIENLPEGVGYGYGGFIEGFRFDPNGGLWLWTEMGGIFHQTASGWQHINPLFGLHYREIMTGIQDHDRTPWFVTYEGLTIIKQNYLVYNFPAQVHGQRTSAMAEDSTRTMYLALESGNIWSFREDLGWQYHAEYAVLSGKQPASLAFDKEGTLWVGTLGHGLYSLTPGSVRQFTVTDGLPSNEITCLFFDPSMTLWCGTAENGVFAFRDSVLERFDTRDGLADNRVTGLALDPWGDLWMGTKNGLSRYSQGAFSTFTTANGLPDNTITAVFADRLSYITVGSAAGLSLYDGRSWINVDVQTGNRITKVLRSRWYDAVWVGTTQGLMQAPPLPMPVPVDGESIQKPGSNLPLAFSLGQNCPNPFNPNTSIEYMLPGPSPRSVSLTVFNLRGQLVRTLAAREAQAPGTYQVHWDGRDSRGSHLPSGVYLYRLTSGDFSATRKMVLIK